MLTDIVTWMKRGLARVEVEWRATMAEVHL